MENMIMTRIIEHAAADMYRRALARKYPSYDVSYLNGLYTSSLFDLTQRFIKNKKTPISDLDEILANSSHELHRYCRNYIYLNAFYETESQIAIDSGKVRSGRGKERSWTDSPTIYTDNLEIYENEIARNVQEIENELAAAADYGLNKSFAYMLLEQYIRADVADFVRSCFTHTDDELKEIYNYDTRRLNQRINNVIKAIRKSLPKYEYLIQSKSEMLLQQERKYIKSFFDLVDQESDLFRKLFNDADRLSDIISDNVSGQDLPYFLEDMQLGERHPAVYYVIAGLIQKENQVITNIIKENTRGKDLAADVADINKIRENKERKAAYKAFTEVQPVYTYKIASESPVATPKNPDIKAFVDNGSI
ncbi:hypothetical protein [Terribacillus saccharophilus]|uniref:DUF3848 domain-containing protein n=1 Tax=Terribacillus saccharophilus TaxID=361277 RepID=A0ABX4GTD5_9BACI|nr:hypothetical protein [Terribacillus saccharophilus]PAD94377.1 hypothetical protein CHH50_18835 [Terribacillus saccharophilus]PAD98125.1 hypothetical protein CHH48_18950 [Terribacillus saccharophilus]